MASKCHWMKKRSGFQCHSADWYLWLDPVSFGLYYCVSNIIFFRKYKRIIIIGNMIVLFKQQKRNIRMPKSVKKLWMMQNVDMYSMSIELEYCY